MATFSRPLAIRRFIMSEEWESEGLAAFEGLDEALNWVLPRGMQTHIYRVRNTETGETKRVRVDPGQSIGEAVANGQWDD